jgi:tRNA A37 methylthiotransferase MiaB
MALSSDFIVGFPGETTPTSRRPWRLVEGIGFAQAFSFKYSKRPGTPAADMDDQVPEDVKTARLEELQALLRRQQDGFNRACAGRVMPVLFDRPAAAPARSWAAAPGCNRSSSTHRRSDRLGDLRDIRIVAPPRQQPCRRARDRTGGGGTHDPRPWRSAAPVMLQFDDNSLLPLLFGEHDQHLARIEQRSASR